jgi:hypothetical protein
MGEGKFGAVHMMIEGLGGIKLWLADDGATEEAVELFPEKEHETKMNRCSKSGCGVWDIAAVARVAEEMFAY